MFLHEDVQTASMSTLSRVLGEAANQPSLVSASQPVTAAVYSSGEALVLHDCSVSVGHRATGQTTLPADYQIEHRGESSFAQISIRWPSSQVPTYCPAICLADQHARRPSLSYGKPRGRAGSEERDRIAREDRVSVLGVSGVPDEQALGD